MFSLTPWKKKNEAVSVGNQQDEFFPLARLRDEFEAIWERFWKDWDREGGFGGFGSGLASGLGSSLGFGPGRNLNNNLPQLKSNWTESEHEYLFQAELPGFAASELDVKVAGQVLRIRAEHKVEEKQGATVSHRQSVYQRSFPLPKGIDAEKIEARYRNGLLEVHLPKSAAGRGRRIQVTSA